MVMRRILPISDQPVSVNKLDAARRQLLAAIHLHWYFDEPIAVYTLAGNAWQLSHDLLKKADRIRIVEEMARSHGRPQKEFWDLINRPRNFFKHADNDPEATAPDVHFSDCDAMIESACVDYMVAAGRSPIVVGIFVAWYSAVYPEKTGDFMRYAGDELFGDLSDLDRAEHLRRARVVAAKPVSSEVLHNIRNEMTDNYRWAGLRAGRIKGLT
jgi:hypothetical protein